MSTRTNHEFERALKTVTRRFPDWDVEVLREVVTTGPDRIHDDTDHAGHLRRIERDFVEYGSDRCRRVKYEALLTELESATRRKPSRPGPQAGRFRRSTPSELAHVPLNLYPVVHLIDPQDPCYAAVACQLVVLAVDERLDRLRWAHFGAQTAEAAA